MFRTALCFTFAAALLAGSSHANGTTDGSAGDTTPTTAEEQITELRSLGRHAEADKVATDAGITVYRSETEFGLPRSFKETMDAGDDPFVPGCVCCYEDRACSIIEGRSVDECYPGGDGGDDLSENIAGTTCKQGVACAKRKRYKCSDLVRGSVCRLKSITCCGVQTTSGYCEVTP